MSNPVKCSGANPSTSVGVYLKNFFIGTKSETAYGPSATTAYYNGYQIPPNGYVVYVYKTTNGPSNYVAVDDTELMTLAKRLGGTSINNVTDALTYINVTNSQTLVLNKDYENYIPSTSLCYDFSYLPSYPRSGSGVYDISTANGGTRNNGTFASSPPGWSDSKFGGYMGFPGNQGLDFSTITPGNNTNYTFIAIVKVNTADASYGTIISNNNGGAVTSAYGTYNGRMSYHYFNGSWNFLSSTGAGTVPIGRWAHLTWTQNVAGDMAMYLNGVSVNTPAATSTTNGGPVNTIGRNWAANFDGDIAKIFYYTENPNAYRVESHYYMGDIFRDSNNSIVPEKFFDVANPVCNTESGTVWNLMLPDGTDPLNPNATLHPSTAYGGTLQQGPGDILTSINADAQNGYTISFWMKYIGSNTPALICSVDDTTTSCYVRGNIKSTGIIEFTVKDAVGNSAAAASTTPVADGFWHHVVLSYQNLGNQDMTYPDYPLPRGVYVYVDGNLEGFDSMSSIPGGGDIIIAGDLVFKNHPFYLGQTLTYSRFTFGLPQVKLNYYATVFRYNN
jgi:hypothetical protein